MFKIIKGEIHKGTGEQTLMFVPNKQKYYIVSSVKYISINPETSVENINYDQTLIFSADSKGNINENNPIWGIQPGNHEEVIKRLLSEDLTELDFDRGEESPYTNCGIN